MRHEFEPLLHPIAIAELRPTQITIGYREVERKRADWRKRCDKDGADFLGRHMIPAVLGPKRRPYIVDHHHLVRALHEEDVVHVLVSIVADLAHLPKSLFWTFMDNRNWLHPYDAAGKRRDHDRIPRRIADLADDPWRSLAGELRRAGGYAKVETRFSEFLWADFLRWRVSAKLIERNFQRALVKALDLAHHEDAGYLPGWCGPAE